MSTTLEHEEKTIANNNPAFNNKDKIEILLKEYDTLRSEVQTRINNVYQLMALFGFCITWLFSRPFDLRFGILLLVLALGFAYAGLLLHRGVQGVASRLREIEAKINFLAGDELLEWETRWGGGVTGYYWRLGRPVENKIIKRDF